MTKGINLPFQKNKVFYHTEKFPASWNLVQISTWIFTNSFNCFSAKCSLSSFERNVTVCTGITFPWLTFSTSVEMIHFDSSWKVWYMNCCLVLLESWTEFLWEYFALCTDYVSQLVSLKSRTSLVQWSFTVCDIIKLSLQNKPLHNLWA